MATGEPSRREMILDAAVALFRTHGFHGAGIDEIGAAAGITGPGVYRHFPNKHALLVAMSERVVDRLVAHNDRVRKEETDPTTALERLIDTHISLVYDSRELISVYVQEERNLPEPDYRRIRTKQRRYVDGWVDLLADLEPGVPPATLRATVRAVLGMLNSVSYPGTAEDAAMMRHTLAHMAMAALRAGVAAAAPAGGAGPVG